MNIYVGNLSWEMDQSVLRAEFAAFGTVDSLNIIMDKMTGRSKGFGFVEMSNDDEAKAAIAALDGKEVGGRAIKVNEAKPKEPRV
jgi:RNA recognition motif-containing protein